MKIAGMLWIKRIHSIIKKLKYLKKKMDRMRWEDFKKENKISICTEKWAWMHRSLCNTIEKIKKWITYFGAIRFIDGFI
jgi:hypothetical protein